MAVSAGEAYVTVLPEMTGFATGVGKGLNRIGNQITRSSRVLTRGITIPVAAAGAASIKMALDFETSIQRVGALTEASQSQVKQWSDQILELGPKLGAAPNDFAQALYFVASSGAKVADVMPITTEAIKASAAGMGDAQTVAQILTSAVNAYGSSNLSAKQAADQLTEAIKVGKAEPEDLAASLGRVIPLAETMGVTFAETAASVSTLTNTGLSAAEATTALRAVLNTLIKPAQQTADQYKKMGISADYLRNSIKEKGLNATLVDLKSRIGDNKDALGKLFPNVRALTGFLALTGKNAQQVARNVDLVTHSVGVANKAFKTAAESDAFKFRKALAGLEAEAVKLGAELLPFATQLIQDITGIVEAFKSLSPEQQKIILGFVGLLAAIGPIGTLFGNLVIISSAVVRGLALIGTAMFTLMGASNGVAAANELVTTSFLEMDAAAAPVITAFGLVATAAAAITEVALLAYMSQQTEGVREFSDAENEAVSATNSLQSALQDLKTGNLDLKQANLDRARAAQQLAKDERAQAAFVRKNGHENHALALQIEQDGLNISNAEVRQAQAKERVREANQKVRKSEYEIFDAQRKAATAARLQAATYEKKLNPALFATHTAQARATQAMLVNTEASKRFSKEQGRVVQKILDSGGAFDAGKKKSLEFALAAQHLSDRIHDIPTSKQVRIELNKNLPYYLGLVGSLKSEIDSLPTDKTTRIHVITERALGGRAAGGPVTGGTPYLVGEVGPELFVPHSSGTIIPNHRLGHGTGGGGRTRIVIENWEEGTGYMTSIADGSVADNSNLNRQRKRMRR